MILTYTSIFLLASILANIYAVFKIKTLIKQPAPTLDARDLLHDLTAKGGAAIKIQVIDPENLFIIRKGR